MTLEEFITWKTEKRKCSSVWISQNIIISIFHAEQKKLKKTPPYLRRKDWKQTSPPLFKAASNITQ